jgi:hypothetical protein
MKNIILCTLLILPLGQKTIAESSSLNLQIPTGPTSYQSDKFKAGELDCSNAIGSATNLEFGVTGFITEPDSFNSDYYNSDSTDIGVYARITIPLGKTARSRIDCNKLFELELKRKRLEIMKLEQELRQLRNLQFEE